MLDQLNERSLSSVLSFTELHISKIYVCIYNWKFFHTTYLGLTGCVMITLPVGINKDTHISALSDLGNAYFHMKIILKHLKY